VVGGLLLVTGIVILLTGSDEVNANWTFENGQGWLAIAVGAILVVAAILMQMMWTSRRVGHRDPIAT
jgi:predicted membrane channel-forming protein YqfA (hemolysin III family)